MLRSPASKPKQVRSARGAPKHVDPLPLIHKHLGANATPVTLSCHGKPLTAYSAPTALTEERIEPITRELAAHQIRAYVGDGGRQWFAIPGVEVLDIVEIAQIGTHNDEADAWRDVHKHLSEIMEMAPFDITFADEAGLAGVFRKRPSRAKARSIVYALMTRLGEALEMMDEQVDEFVNAEEESVEEDDDDDVDLDESDKTSHTRQFVRYVMARGRFRLWWD